MTREEAIKRLEWLEMVAEYVDSVTIGSKCTEDWDAYNMAIAALREQDAADTNVGHKSNADHLRSMSDEELANLLCTADWCETCDQLRQDGTCQAMELDGPLGKHCVSAGLRWLRQPYKEET